MVYGIIQLINFAHGEVVMIGAMVALSVITALAGAHTGAAAARDRRRRRCWSRSRSAWRVGYTLERVAYRPLRRAPRLAPLITAIGLSIILQHLALIIWSRNPIAVPADHRRSSRIHLTGNPDGATITNVQIAIIVALGRDDGRARCCSSTARKLGIAMRATSQNQQVAGLMGIDINRVIALTFVIGAALGAVAGVMVGTYYGIAHYQMGFLLGLKAFSAAVLGGIGNLAGAMLGGLLLGSSRRSARATSATSPTCASSSDWSDALAERCVGDPEPRRCSAATTRTCSRSSC